MECEFPRVNSDRDEIERYLEDTKSIAVGLGLLPKS